jgi:hypothetical protein
MPGKKSKYLNAPRDTERPARPVMKMKLTAQQIAMLINVSNDDLDAVHQSKYWMKSAKALIERGLVAWTRETKTGMRITDHGKTYLP